MKHLHPMATNVPIQTAAEKRLRKAAEATILAQQAQEEPQISRRFAPVPETRPVGRFGVPAQPSDPGREPVAPRPRPSQLTGLEGFRQNVVDAGPIRPVPFKRGVDVPPQLREPRFVAPEVKDAQWFQRSIANQLARERSQAGVADLRTRTRATLQRQRAEPGFQVQFREQQAREAEAEARRLFDESTVEQRISMLRRSQAGIREGAGIPSGVTIQEINARSVTGRFADLGILLTPTVQAALSDIRELDVAIGTIQSGESLTGKSWDAMQRYIIKPGGAAINLAIGGSPFRAVTDPIGTLKDLTGMVARTRSLGAAFRTPEGEEGIDFEARIDALTDELDLAFGQQGAAELVAAAFLDPLWPIGPLAKVEAAAGRAIALGATGAARGVGQVAGAGLGLSSVPVTARAAVEGGVRNLMPRGIYVGGRPLEVPRGAATPVRQNFAQFLDERGITDPGLDRGPLSPVRIQDPRDSFGPRAARTSDTEKRAVDERRKAEFAKFDEAQVEFQRLVTEGKIVDPTGRFTPIVQPDPPIAQAARLRQRADELERLADRYNVGALHIFRREAAQLREQADALTPGEAPLARLEGAPLAGRQPFEPPSVGVRAGAALEAEPAAPVAIPTAQVGRVSGGLPDWPKVDFWGPEDASQLADTTASRAIWDVTTPDAKPNRAHPTIATAERARGQMASALSSYPDVPPLLARRGEVEAFLYTQGRGDIVVAEQNVKAARTFWEGPYGGLGNTPQWERVILNAEEAVKRAKATRAEPGAPATAVGREVADLPPEVQRAAHVDAGAPDGVRTVPDEGAPAAAEVPPAAAAGPPTRPPGEPPAPPTEPPGPSGMPSPNEPALTLERVRRSMLPGERFDQRALKLHEAAVSVETRRAGILVQRGNDKLRDAGIGVRRGPNVVIRESEVARLDELFTALHQPSRVASGEIRVPAGLQKIYDDLRRLTDWEETARLDFNPEMATIEDYFFRGWQPPEGMFGGVPSGRGQLVRRPDFTKPRVGATYTEMRELGFEPLNWNPYEQWRISRLQGVRHRQQKQLVEVLKNSGEEMIRPVAAESIPAGFRIPRVGPAFEGKPIAIINEAGEAQMVRSSVWMVDHRIANTLEGLYGSKPSELTSVFTPSGRRINLGAIIDWLTFIPKRFKLFLSFFQQQDFMNRAGFGAWARAVDAAQAGQPIEVVTALARYPRTVKRILEANFRPSTRRSLAEQFDDTSLIVEGRPDLHMKLISENGLNYIDFSLFPANMDKVVRDLAKTGPLAKSKAVLNAIGDLEGMMRRGLFNGTYPAAILNDVRYNIAPQIVRQHPGMTDEALASLIAHLANTRYSTIPQTVNIIQNWLLKNVLKRLFFSMNESEGLLRQASGVVSGPAKQFWIQHWVGGYLYLMTTAEIIHFASTGEHLPLDRYTPISKGGYGPLPFGYNTRFAAPTVPLIGRGGVAQTTLDLVGQMDTAFRVLDPVSFITSRESVPVRALSNQISGTNFFDQPINDVGPGGVVSRTLQLANDLFAPIGIGQAAIDIGRELIPGAADIIPEQEGRLGTAGRVIQAGGFNLRAETTPDVIVRDANEQGFTTPQGESITDSRQLSPSQRKNLSPDVQVELQNRTETQAARGSARAQQRLATAAITEDRQRKERGLVNELLSDALPGDDRRDQLKLFRDTYSDIQSDAASERAGLNRAFEPFSDEPRDDPFQEALAQYYDAFDEARTESGRLDFDRLEEVLNGKGFTLEQMLYISENSGLSEHPPLIEQYLQARNVVSASGYYDESTARARLTFRRRRPDVDAARVLWWGAAPVTNQGRDVLAGAAR